MRKLQQRGGGLACEKRRGGVMHALAMGTHEQRRRNLMKKFQKRATADGKLNKNKT